MKKIRLQLRNNKMRKFFHLFVILKILYITNAGFVNANIYTISNSGVNGMIELTSAINSANLTIDKDTIYFNIPSNGPHQIPIAIQLPQIIHPLFIDGFSQPGNDTLTWSIRLTGDNLFEINSHSCTIRGIHFTNTAPLFSYTAIKFINSQGGGFNAYDCTVELSYFAGFDYCILIDAYNYYSIQNFKMSNNWFYGNVQTLYMISSTDISFQDILIENNYFEQNFGIGLRGTGQIQPENLVFINNFVSNTRLNLFTGVLSHALLYNNIFTGNSPVTIGAGIDSVVISQNIFQNNSLLTVNIGDSLSHNLYVLNNLFDTGGNGRKLRIAVAGTSGLFFAKDIFVRNNHFVNNSGIGISVSTTSGIARVTNLKIENNELSDSTFNLNGELIDIGIDATGGKASADSVFILNNTLVGGYIKYYQSGAGNYYIRNCENIHISRNSISSCSKYSILIYVNENILRKMNIDSNYISNCKTGICIENKPSFSPPGQIKQLYITNNQITNCDSVGIMINNLPYFSPAVFDTIIISGNVIDSNMRDGIRIWTIMEYVGFENRISNLLVNNNFIVNNFGNGILFENYGDTASILSSPVLDGLTYSANSIYNNGQAGIRIINHNDPGYPVSPIFPVPILSAVLSFPGYFVIAGYLTGEPNTYYNLELFRNQVPDVSGYGEGQEFLMDTTGITDFSGNSQFQFLIPGTPGNYFYSTTATNLVTKNTSEFSNAIGYTTALYDFSMNEYFRAFPVPFHDELTLLSENPFEQSLNIELFEITGKKITNLYSGLVNSGIWTKSFNLETLQSGIYYIKLRGDKNSTLRIVKN